MNLYFYHQRSDFERIRKRKDNFIVSFLRISISLIEVLHHHPRHSTWDIQTIQELSKLNVLLLSKGVFPNYRLKLFCRFSAKFSHLIHYFLKICDRTYLPAIFFRFSLAKTKVHYSAKKTVHRRTNAYFSLSFLKRSIIYDISRTSSNER